MAVVNTPWSGASSGYTDEQYQRACVLDRASCGMQMRDMPPKTRCGLPVKEPSGAINRNGVHAAAARLNQVDACPTAKRQAASRLASIYRNDLKEPVPDVVARMAGG